MNYDKSTAVWIGPLRHSRVKYMSELNFVWNPATFKTLGVVFCTCLNKANVKVFESGNPPIISLEHTSKVKKSTLFMI